MSNSSDIEALSARAADLQSGELIRMASPACTNADRKFLRSLGHHLSPVVQIGQKGLSEGLIDAVGAALRDHELIKLRVHDNSPVDANIIALWLNSACDAQAVQLLGSTLLAYRARDQKPTIRLPSAKSK